MLIKHSTINFRFILTMIDFYSGCDLIRNSDTGLLVNKTFDINGWGKFTSFGLRIFFCWLRCNNYIRHRYILQSAAQLCNVFLLRADFVYVTDKIDQKTDRIRLCGHNVLSYKEGETKLYFFPIFCQNEYLNIVSNKDITDITKIRKLPRACLMSACDGGWVEDCQESVLQCKYRISSWKK